MLYIVGHIKPDLDSAVAALAKEKLYRAVSCFDYKNAKAVLASPANFESETIFAKFGADLPPVLNAKDIKPEDKFILVDHNEKDQRLQGIKDEQIVDIIDHHKVVLNLGMPIFITCKPWGSSATIIRYIMETCKFTPNKQLASLMLCAILSDTVGLKSATTTQKDKTTTAELAKIAGIKDIDGLVLAIFKAKSSLAGLSTRQVLTKDYKIMDLGGKKVLINQVETVEQGQVTASAHVYLAEMEIIKSEMGLDYIYCAITDVLRINSVLLTTPAGEGIVQKAFPGGKKLKNGVYDIGPLLSRKKEIAPALESVISNR